MENDVYCFPAVLLKKEAVSFSFLPSCWPDVMTGVGTATLGHVWKKHVGGGRTKETKYCNTGLMSST